MKTLALLSLLILSFKAYSHGAIEKIECHNKDNSAVLQGHALKDNNVFSFEAKHNHKRLFKAESIPVELRDSFENRQLIENITFKLPGTGSAHLKIKETPARSIRSGTGKFVFSKHNNTFSGKEPWNCYAVY